MKSFAYTITDEIGIHARPAGLLVKEAKNYQSAITLTSAAGKSADVRKLMALMALAVKHGETVTITAEGADEEMAIAGMEAFFKANL
jgi:phosphocarrier protein